jgi:predicted DNA-binding helix-hairpin-helix protein
LYQADWLLRFYGFKVNELTTPDDPQLDLAIDPKTAWALRHREQFPVDVNRASREMLLRVPGLGARNVQRILQIRLLHSIRLADLVKLRVPMARAKYFVVTADHNPDSLRIDRMNLRSSIVKPERQLNLFDLATAAKTGEL